MSDMAEGFKALNEHRKQRRAELGRPCPRCKERLPRAQPKILMPGQRCRHDGYVNWLAGDMAKLQVEAAEDGVVYALRGEVLRVVQVGQENGQVQLYGTDSVFWAAFSEVDEP